MLSFGASSLGGVFYAIDEGRALETSSSNPDNVRRNLQYISEPIDWQLVREVQGIIGEQQRVTWANTNEIW